MRLLLDTHVLIWLALEPSKLSRDSLALLEDSRNEMLFSAVSIWEIAIKHALKKPDFRVDPRDMRQACLDNSIREIAMTSDHAIVVGTLPLIHRDPFDRLLVAQAVVEAAELVTRDRTIARYGPPVRLV